MTKPRTTDSGMPLREPGRALNEAQSQVVGHQHEGLDDPNHRHRLGQLPHGHDEDGRPIVGTDVKFVPPDTDPTLVLGNSEVAAPSPPGTVAEMADPPATPGVMLTPPESSVPVAGSGGGAGRSFEQVRRQQTMAEWRTDTTARPDASEAVLGTAMGIINPAADPEYTIRHAEASARVLIIGQHVGNMFAAIRDGHMPSEADVRAIYAKLRLMAATHGIDLDDEGAGS